MRRHLAVLGLAAAVSAAAASPAAASTAAYPPKLGSIGIRLMNAPVSERANPGPGCTSSTTWRRVPPFAARSRSPT